MEMFRWSNLKVLGEQRLLRVSYIIFALIPIWAGVCSLLHDAADRVQWRVVANESQLVNQAISICKEYGSKLSESTADEVQNRVDLRKYSKTLQQYLLQLEIERSEIDPPSGYDGLPQEPGDPARRQDVAMALYQLADKESLLFSPKHRVEWEWLSTQWTFLEGERMAALVLSRPEVSRRMKLLWVSMLLLSIANIIYATRCPEMLRMTHRPDRQGTATGFGDEADWKCVAARTLDASNPTSTSYILWEILNMTTHRIKATVYDPGLDVSQEERISAFLDGTWSGLQYWRKWSRRLCGSLYFISIALTIVWLFFQAKTVIFQ